MLLAAHSGCKRLRNLTLVGTRIELSERLRAKVWTDVPYTQSTIALHLRCKTRPVRIAFLMEKPEHTVLQEILNINTLLWGGILNPIVVLDGRSCPAEEYPSYTYEEGILRLLREFDPDVLINYSGSDLPDSLAAFKRRTFDRTFLRWNPWGNEEIYFYLEVWPFLRKYWRNVHQFLKKPEQAFTYMDLSDSGVLKSYLLARYGGYPADGNGNNILANDFDAAVSRYDEDFRKSFATGEKVFPIQLTAFGLHVPNPGIGHSHTYFLLDPTNIFDIVDCWNLRATGARVFQLPIDQYKDFELSILAFGEEATYPINDRVMNHPTIVKGKSLSNEQLFEAGRWMAGLGLKDISCQGWVPHFGDRGYRVAPELTVHSPAATDYGQTLIMTNGHGMMEPSAPDCEFAGPARSQHWALELLVFGSGDQEHTWRLPWLCPECDEYANIRVAHGFESTKSRVGKEGIVVIRRGDRDTFGVQEPAVKDVLKSFLKNYGFRYRQISAPGLALERIVDQLGGLFGCRMFQNPGVRELIQKLSNGAQMHIEEVRVTLLKNTPMKRRQQIAAAHSLLEDLIQKRVLRQGIKLQCERCQRSAWYRLGEFSDEFRCKLCFHVQPMSVIGENPWECISDGLFTLPGKMAGCITAATALVSLSHFLHHDFRYVASFEYGDASGEAERDFAIMTSELLRNDVDLIFGECKTAESFDGGDGDAKDVNSFDLQDKEKNHMQELGKRTGAYLAFCTLAPDFSDSDKNFFASLVEDKQKLILLTRTHLEMDYIRAMKYTSERHAPLRDVELLSRLTVIDVLGKEVAEKNRIWLW